jgi:hypothetical protein
VQPVELTKDQFLSQTVLLFQGGEFSVRDMIDVAAHLEGGVHLGVPRDERAGAVLQAAIQIRVGGYSPVVRSLQAIGRVVLKGLQPLRTAVESE